MNSFSQKLYHRMVPQSWRAFAHLVRHRDEYFTIPKTALTFAEDGLFTQHAAPFLEDEHFQQAYRAGVSTNSWHGNSIRWRAFVACWAAQHAKHLLGDFVECGVNRGGLSRCIVDYLGFADLPKRFFLVDTYAGLAPDHLTAEEQQADLMKTYAYYQENSVAIVEKTFAAFKNVHVVQGVVPEILPSLPVEQVSFLSLDMNCVLPEQQAAEFFWPRMPPGGIILHDDYGFAQHALQRRMLDQFAEERGVSVLALPTGQGLIIKPSADTSLHSPLQSR